MAFSHVQGGHVARTNQPVTIPLPVNPTKGNLVCIAGIASGAGAIGTITVQDTNNNIYTLSPSTPYLPPSGGNIIMAYLLSAPANATNSIVVSWTGAPTNFLGYAEEFSVDVGSILLDTDAAIETAQSGFSIVSPSITPTHGSEMFYAFGDPFDLVTAPAAGASLGVWTGAAGGIDPNGYDAEYSLNQSTSTAVNFTCSTSGDVSAAMMMAFYQFIPPIYMIAR